MNELAPNRTLITEKRKLREAMLARRRTIPHAAMVRASESIARHFADHPILAFMPSFAGYLAIQGELDMRQIFAAMARFQKETSLPCVTEQKILQFRRWREGNPLIRHPMGMQEPEPTAPAMIPSLVLVPLLAFDGDGYRLGYGGGYYDRTMERMRQFEVKPLFIGVAYSSQEIDQVPTNEQDMQLDGILTELGVSMFGR